MLTACAYPRHIPSISQIRFFTFRSSLLTGKPCKKPATGWRWDEEHTKAALAENPPRIHFGETEETIPCRKSYLAEVDTEPFHSVFYKDGRGSSKLLEAIMGKGVFDFPKDPSVLADFFNLITAPNDIILDSFGGSGSTAHAVLNMNKTDGGNRKFILIEMCDYAETITAERVRRVISGYGDGKKQIEGTGGGFTFYELGEPLLNGEYLNENVPLDKIRSYVYFTETKQPVTNKDDEPHFLGVYLDTAYYFYYDRDAVTTLDRDFLRTVRTNAESYVIYADRCILSDEELEKYHITFKKIPRDITRL